MSIPKRPFSSGSREAPDPIDQFLMQAGFYRKHTARDASSLFRCVSEYIFDGQYGHEQVRADCVEYMSKNRDIYEEYIAGDFDDYLCEMSKLRTHGTLLELEILANYYQRNVVLFEPYNFGTWFVDNKYHEQTMNIFYSPENHFDTVYSLNYIENAAFCQSICYEMLYSKVFKLPDVTYAVERMLHDPADGGILPIKTFYEDGDDYPVEIVSYDGRSFLLDKPDNTKCILDNFMLCHFHNENFDKFATNLRNEANNPNRATRASRILEHLLPEKYISCVRQLLENRITPFPYKVAKALDPDIYRNVEYDTWSNIRREIRIRRWYNNGNTLWIGSKCLVKLHRTQRNYYNCHIQNITNNKEMCEIYIEELGARRVVPFGYLTPLPLDQVKPYPIPYRIQRSFYRYNNYARNPVEDFAALNKHCPNNKPKVYCEKKCYETDHTYEFTPESKELFNTYKLAQYTDLHHFQPAHNDIMAMPLMVGNNNDNNPNTRLPPAANKPQTSSANAQSKNISDSDRSKENDSFESSVEMNGSYMLYTRPSSFHHHSNSIQYVPGMIDAPYDYTPYCPHDTYGFPIRHRQLLEQMYSVNSQARPSYNMNGSDLPPDISTLRFFYNLGHEYYNQLQSSYPPSAILALGHCGDERHVEIMTNNRADATQNVSDEMAKMKIEKSHQKNENSSRRYVHSRTNNKKDKNSRQPPASSQTVPQHYQKDQQPSQPQIIHKNGSNKSKGDERNTNTSAKQAKHFNPFSVDPAQQKNSDRNVPPPTIKSAEPNDDRSGFYNNNNTNEVAQQPLLQMAPQTAAYPQYIPCYMENNEQSHSMYMAPIPYGMYAQNAPPGIPQYAFPPPIPPHHIPSNHMHTGPMVPNPNEMSAIENIEPNQYSYFAGPIPAPMNQFFYPAPPQQIAIAPQGFWYPPPSLPVGPSPLPSNISVQPQPYAATYAPQHLSPPVSVTPLSNTQQSQ